MNSKALVMGFTIAIGAVSFNANAAVAKDALDACAKAMTSQMASRLDTPISFRLDQKTSTIATRNKGGVWYLDARDPETQEVVARVDCVVDRRFVVQELITIPLTSEDARLRARSH